MKRIFVAVVFLSVCSGMLHAQNNDSVSVSKKNRDFAADSAARYLSDLAIKRPYLIGFFIPENFNKIAIGHQIGDGGFVPAQGATHVSETYLHTQGRKVLGDISLWGSFNYRKTSEDSTRWAQQSRNNTSAPYYFGSAAPINFNRSVYQFSGVAERNMIKDNIPLIIGIDYRIGDHFATNDPRGAVGDFQLNLVGATNYNFNKIGSAGIGLKYGYGQERIDVGYKNRSYFESTVYPDYTNYAINGYGEPTPKNNNRRFDADMDRFGFEGYLMMDFKAFGQLVAAASYDHESQFFNSKSTDSELIISHNDYDLNTLDADLVWTRSNANRKFVLAFNYLTAEGSDYNYTINSNNYLYSNNSLSLKSVLTVNAQQTYNYHLEFTKEGEERQDGLNGNKVSYDNLKIEGGAGVVFDKRVHSWGVNLSGFYLLPLNDEFVVPIGNEKIFTRGVIYHDYLFNTSSSSGVLMSADYNFPGYKGIQTGFRLAIGYIGNIRKGTLERTLTSVPGNHRLSANLSLNLYF